MSIKSRENKALLWQLLSDHPFQKTDPKKFQSIFEYRINAIHNERFRYKKSHKRPAWGVLGMSIEESIPFIGQREDAVKTTPVSTLSPLDGWTKLEIKNLKNHFEKPSKYRFHEDTRSWQF